MATYNPITGKKMLTIPTSTPAPKQDVLGKLKDLGLGQKNETPTDQAYLEGATENMQNVYSGYSGNGVVASPKKILNIPSANKSVAVMFANKNGTTSSLPQAISAGLPGVTKYAGIDKNYGNNQAGIDLVNRQGSTEMLTAGEAAQRTAGQYEKMPLPGQKIANVAKYQDNSDGTTTQYLDDGTSETVRLIRNVDGTYSTQDVGQPAPTVATTQNPVIKKTLPKEETPVRPDIQSMDLPTINENIDRLTYKVNNGKSLTEDEYVTFNQLKRQAIEMMKPQSLKGGLDNLQNIQQNDITTTQQTLDEQNAKDLEAFTKSQESYRQAQLAMIDQEANLSKQRMAAIFGATGQDSSTDTVSSFGQMEQNYSLQKQAKIEEVQAKIDLFGSQQRKDSAETIQKMKDKLYGTQLKAAEFDVANLQEINKYNQEQGKDVLTSLNDLKAASDAIIASSTPLTEDQKAKAEVIGNLLIDENGKVNETLLASYRKTNPNLIPYATSIAVQQKNKVQEDKMAMLGLDADIKRAQLNKLLNPDIDYKVTANDDGTYTRTGSDGSIAIVDPKSGASTSAVETIKKWEGFRDKAYQDSTGTRTIGYGFTNVDGKPVQPGMTMDRGTADNLLGQEISQRQNFMNYITVPLSDSQKAALSSFEFNLGSGIREKNAKPILDKINAGDLQGAGNLMKQYTTSKGQQLQGLVNRRNEEARLLLDKTQTQNNIIDPSTGKVIEPAKATQIQDALFAIEDLEKTSGKEGAVGYSRQKNLNTLIPGGENKFIAGTDAANFEAKFNKLTNMLTLPNLDKLKGAMSDKDIAFLKSASSALSLNMSEKEFDTTLKQVKEKFQNMLGVQPQEQTQTKTVTKTGTTKDGKKVVQYSDGTIEYQ